MSGYSEYRELIETFHAELDGALQGRGLRPRSGLDRATSDALRAIAAAWPAVPAHFVAAAEDAFARQLGGDERSPSAA